MEREYIGRKYIKNPAFVFRKIGEECILVPTFKQPQEGEAIYTLNETAALVWGMLGENNSIEQYVCAVCDEFEVEREEAEKDVLELLEELTKIGAAQES